MPWYDRDPEEPETRSLSLRAWSTSDKKPKGGNARLFDTSDGTGGNLRINPRPQRPATVSPIEALRERLRRLRNDSGDGKATNPRTGRWAAPWKAEPGPGSVKDARARMETARKATQFRPGDSRITDRQARRRGGFQSTGGTARGGFKRLTARENGRRGGRPRTASRPTPVRAPATDQVRNRGWFTPETARQAGARGGSRSTSATRAAARVNARKRTATPPLG